MADPNKRFLDTAAGLSAYVWALERGLRFAAATAVVALAASTLFSGADAERFATTAYLAAIVAALALMLRWFVREVHPPQGERGPLFPAILTFVLWLAFFIGAGITLGSQPGAALPTIVAAFGLIAIAALVRGGALLKLCTKLSGGDRLSAVTRFAVAAAITALVAGVLLGSAHSEALAQIAYLSAIVATTAVAASLIAPTHAGSVAQRLYDQTVERGVTPANASIFAQTTEYAVATATAAILLASLLPQPYSERFATAAYLAVFFAILATAGRCILRNVGIEPEMTVRTRAEWFKFAGSAVGLALLGAAFAFSYMAEAIAIVVCLGLVGVAVVKRIRMTTAQ